MFAWMNEEALALTLETGLGHFWSRSRARAVEEGRGERQPACRSCEMRTDCDQDVVWLRARVEGDGLACHTGRAQLLLPFDPARELCRMPQCRSSQCSAIRANHDAIALQRLTNFARRVRAKLVQG